LPESHEIARSFDDIARHYDSHAALEQEVGTRLLARTAFKRLEPARILDLGCGSGGCAAGLKKSFRKAQVLGLDISGKMLAEARRKAGLRRLFRLVRADMSRLPLSNQSVDMVFANLSTYWAPDPEALFAEIRRILRSEGMFLFTGFGPGTLRQLAEAGSRLDESIQMPVFPDLLETGDALAAAGFREPVMDTERITLCYSSLDNMMDELQATGMALLVRGWEKWKNHGENLEQAWRPTMVEGQYPLSFEIVYGVAFGPPEGQPRRTAEGEVATFSVDSLLKSRSLGYS
jgi:malonyl-CoA O-methyltransferase